MTDSPAPTAVRITTVAAVVVVAIVAAVVSYSHMTELAHRAGEQWRSWLIPISVDGLIVAASMVLLTRHRAGQPGGYLTWGSLSVGVLASLAANMADARPEVTSVLVAGWAPVAFAAAFHLLLQQRRAEYAAPMISDLDRPERSSERSVRPGSDLTGIAPLNHSGSPAGRGDTVLPGRDSLGDPLSRPAPSTSSRSTLLTRVPGWVGESRAELWWPVRCLSRSGRRFRSGRPGQVKPNLPVSGLPVPARAASGQVQWAGPTSSSCRRPASCLLAPTGRSPSTRSGRRLGWVAHVRPACSRSSTRSRLVRRAATGRHE